MALLHHVVRSSLALKRGATPTMVSMSLSTRFRLRHITTTTSINNNDGDGITRMLLLSEEEEDEKIPYLTPGISFANENEGGSAESMAQLPFDPYRRTAPRPLPFSKPLPVIPKSTRKSKVVPRASSPKRTVIFSPDLELEYYNTPKVPPTVARFSERQGAREHKYYNIHNNVHSWNPPMVPKVPATVAGYLERQGGTLPVSSWILIENIPPLSSLESMLQGVDNLLNTVCEDGGIVDLDANYDEFPGSVYPVLLTEPTTGTGASSSSDAAAAGSDGFETRPFSRWVRKAHLRLSPYGRPNGWYMLLPNRSVVYALMEYCNTVEELYCASNPVRVHPCFHAPPSLGVASAPLQNLQPFVDESTVRLENCPPSVSITKLMQMFSRFDLASRNVLESRQQQRQLQLFSVNHHHHHTQDGQENHFVTEPIVPWTWNFPLRHPKSGRVLHVPNTTYLVHFASPAWARAAVREQQGVLLLGPYAIRLAQYPKQLL